MRTIITEFLMVGIFLIMAGCSVVPVKPAAEYSRTDRNGFYDLDHWFLEGRLALVTKEESLTANINWKRRLNEESIRLSGPLGQGGIFMRIADGYVAIDRGAGC